MKIKLLLITLIFLSLNSFAQRTCGTKAYMQEKMQDLTFKTNYEARQVRFNEEFLKLKNTPESERRRRATIKIPVAVHFPAGNASDRTCLEAFAQTQIDVINKDYTATNTDISNWTVASTHYPGVNTGMIDIEFIIANKNHPSGSDIADGSKAVTIGTQSGTFATTDENTVWAGYMNFVIKTLDSNTLGYSPLAGSPSAGHTVVMNTYAYGTGAGCSGYTPTAPATLGRTVTHELGHFFNLEHTWGGGGCSSTDDVADTPQISEATYGCETAGSTVQCTNKSLTMNFMDYADDPCMYMFTAGQATRSLAYINSIISQYKSDVIDSSSLAVDTEIFDKSFSIYPNPTKNELNIIISNNILEDNSKYEIYTIIGKKVARNSLDSSLIKQTINISNLSSGIYLLKIISGKNLIVKKILIE